jgi:hypothetical protein
LRRIRGKNAPAGLTLERICHLIMDFLILAFIALRRSGEEKRIPEPEFQPFRLEYLRPVNEMGGEHPSRPFDELSEIATV